VDVADTKQVATMVQAAEKKYGRIDVLVNAAGVLFYGTILETDDAAWERVMNINLKGTFLCCRAVVPIMLQKGSGSIVNFSSTTGAHDACAHAVAYVTSKGGVAAFTRAVSIDHARQGIRVNAICPGPTDTPMLRGAMNAAQLAEFADGFPAGRLSRRTARQAGRNRAGSCFSCLRRIIICDGSMLFVDGGQTAQV
jgi:NAD(P)-dependent dehydrogenase (short-subunit alcohol dehydrogenase family)